MASPVTAGITNDFLCCPICSNHCRTPKLLPCLHTFCLSCLEDCLKRSSIGHGQSFLCPICHYECVVPKRGVPSLQGNIFQETLDEFLAKKEVPKKKLLCQGCESEKPAIRKCVECDDWLCKTCCSMHVKVKVTKDHHLVTSSDLKQGEHDDLLKQCFDPLICGKHEEPLKLYCTEPTCLTPICTVCKNTLGHDGHRAIELEEQARADMKHIQSLMGGVENSLNAVNKKISNVKLEEKITANGRKDIHKAINARMDEMVESVVKQITDYAESLHEQVEAMAKEHKQNLTAELSESKFKLQGMTCAQIFAQNLLNFNRAEEVVSMARPVYTCLQNFQTPPGVDAPGWRQPRIEPANPISHEQVADMFGKLTMVGAVIQSVLMKSFSTKISGDDRECSLSDIAVTEDNDIIVMDKDNKKVKVFDSEGQLLFATKSRKFRAPNRLTLMASSGNALVKDEKILKLLDQDGEIVGEFARSLKQPVGLAHTSSGEVLITDWMTGCVHCFSEAGQELYKFNCICEAPAYVSCSQDGNDIVVSDWKQNIIKAFTKNGNMKYQYGGQGAGVGQLNHPYGMCVDMNGRLLVADNWNNRVHLVSRDGRFLRYVLTKDDGLQWPQALAIDHNGHLVVAELQGQVKIYQYLA